MVLLKHAYRSPGDLYYQCRDSGVGPELLHFISSSDTCPALPWTMFLSSNDMELPMNFSHILRSKPLGHACSLQFSSRNCDPESAITGEAGDTQDGSFT